MAAHEFLCGHCGEGEEVDGFLEFSILSIFQDVDAPPVGGVPGTAAPPTILGPFSPHWGAT